MAEIGSSGLQISGGQVYEDFLREWRLPQSYKNAREMALNSPIIAALLSAIEQSVLKTEWSLSSELGEDDERLTLWADSVRLLENGWRAFISEALTALPFGFCLFEICWGSYNGRTIVKKLAVRGQDTVSSWLMDDTGKLNGFVQCAAPRYQLVTIPIEKLIHIKTRSERGNPEGRSILRTAWVPYYYYKNIQQIEAIGIERDLAGLPLVTLPPTANTNENDSNSDASKAAKIVRNVRQDEQAGVVVPDGWKFELLSTGGSRQFDTDKIITRYESRILMTALAQFLMLGQQNVGSLALSRDQSDLFVMSVNATADIISEAVETQLIPRLMALNGYTADGLEFSHTPAGDADLTAIADSVTKFTQAGFLTPMPNDEVYVRKLLKLPEVNPDDLQAEKDRKDAIAQSIAQATMQKQEQPEKEKPEPDETEEVEPEDVEETGEEVDEETATLARDYAKGKITADEYAAQLRTLKQGRHLADVEYFFTSTRPDAVNRRRYETKMQRDVAAIFKNMKNKVVSAVREGNRNA